MSEWTHDGTPIQPGTCRYDYALTGHRAHYSIMGLREMVVVARYYVDDVNNRSKRFVEYTCRDLYTSELYPGCRQLSQMSGVDDGDDNVLKPSTNLLPGVVGVTGAIVGDHTPAKDVDGDQVLVGFIEGSRSRPVIIGVFRHSASKYGASTSAGERRLTQHKGTKIEIDKVGAYTVTHKSGSTVTLNDDGSVDIVAAGGQVVRLGSHTASDAAVRGTSYRSAEDSMLSQLSSTMTELSAYAVGIAAIADPLSVVTPQLIVSIIALQAAIAIFQAGAATYLSTTVDVAP